LVDQPFEARRARRLLRVLSVPIPDEAEEPLLPVVALAPMPELLDEPIEEPLPVEAPLPIVEPLPIEEPLLDAPLPMDEEPPFMPGAVEGPALPGVGSDAPD